MRRIIQSVTKASDSSIEVLSAIPASLLFSLAPSVHRGAMHPSVQVGDIVKAGQKIAEGEWQTQHTALAGEVLRADDAGVEIRCSVEQEPWESRPVPIRERRELPAYFREMGLAGMGGGRFPYGRRFDRTPEHPPHTLVINAVECEPGIGIDESLLLHQRGYVAAAVEALTSVLELRRCVLAVRRSARRHLESAADVLKTEWLIMPDRYPGGAGKLITAKLSGHMPKAGTLNTDLGFVICNVASLWTLGRRLLEGRPCMERPLTVSAPGHPDRQLVVLLRMAAGEVLSACGISRNEKTQMLTAEGRMMGRAAELDFRVDKGTNALMVLNRERRWERPEQPCILCGSCFDACPLGLHPIGMAQRIRKQQSSRSLETQLNECFLCGACSAVCPADIPLVQIFREGKTWLKNNR